MLWDSVEREAEFSKAGAGGWVHSSGSPYTTSSNTYSGVFWLSGLLTLASKMGSETVCPEEPSSSDSVGLAHHKCFVGLRTLLTGSKGLCTSTRKACGLWDRRMVFVYLC